MAAEDVIHNLKGLVDLCSKSHTGYFITNKIPEREKKKQGYSFDVQVIIVCILKLLKTLFLHHETM